MTAPLPPLDEYGFWTSEFCKTYAKLAVREALETALLRVMDYNDRDTIRAMLKEYEG